MTRSFVEVYSKYWQTKLKEGQVTLNTKDVMTMALLDPTQGKSGLTDDLQLKVHHYIAKYCGRKPLEDRLDALKYMLNELWVHQRVPYLLFSTNDEYHYCPLDKHSSFSIPIKLLILWEYSRETRPS